MEMADVHFFDVHIAERYGIHCAVLLQNLWHWLQKNEANGVNFYDGRYWTYNSTKAFKGLFPYLSQRQIETALKRLRDEGIIETGNYNAVKYDRTLWYALTEKGKSILLGCEMDLTAKGKGFDSGVEPIPDINTDVNADSKPYRDIIAYLNEKAGTAYRASSQKTQEKINARLAEGYTVDDFKLVIDKRCAEWIGTEFEQYLRPETLFGPRFEGYLNAKAKAKGGKNDGSSGQGVARKLGEKLGVWV